METSGTPGPGNDGAQDTRGTPGTEKRRIASGKRNPIVGNRQELRRKDNTASKPNTTPRLLITGERRRNCGEKST